MSFWGELKRRKVVQVATVYAVVAWLLIQVVGEIGDPLQLPPWFDTFIIVLLAVGFPIAVILAWAFDLGPEGIRTEESAAAARQSGRGPGAFANISQFLILVAVGFLIVDQSFLSAADSTAVAPSATTSTNVFPLTILENQPLASSRWSIFSLAESGRRFVYQAQAGIYVYDFDAGEPRLIAGSENVFAVPFLSPDGRFVGYWSTGGEVVRLAIEGGVSEVVTSWQGVSAASWADDDSILIVQDDVGISRVPATGSDLELLVPIQDGMFFSSPRLLPDGDTVLFSATTRDWDEAEILAYSRSTGDLKRVHGGGSDARYVDTGHLVYVVGDRLFGVAFDLETLETSGTAREIESGITRAVAVGSADYGISRDGTLAYISRRAEGRRKLVWVERDGTASDIGITPGNYWYAQLSPDDSLVAINGWEGRERRVWTGDVARGGDPRRLSSLDEVAPTTGVWSADSRVAYTVGNEGGSFEIVTRPADRSSGARTLYRFAPMEFLIPGAFTPDGLTLLAMTAAPPRSTWAIRLSNASLEGDGVPLLADEGLSLYNASVSPDGNWIAFQSDRSGSLEIYVRPYPDADPDREVQISTNGGLNPVWSRDPEGSELFFLEPADEPGFFRLMSVAVTESDETFRYEPPLALFTERFFAGFSSFIGPYDVSLDGSRFLIIQDAPVEDATSGTSEIVIVQNWVEKLKALVPAQ